LTDGRLAGKCRAFVLGRKVRGTKALSIREIIRVIETSTFPPTPAFPTGV